MDPRAIRAGIGSGIVALVVGGVLGTYGGWAPVFNLAGSQLGSWALALALSTFLVYIYGYWFNAFLPGTAVVRGVTFGILVWILMLILGGVSTFFKEATYPDPAGPTVFLTLMLHTVWGSILGLLYEVRQ